MQVIGNIGLFAGLLCSFGFMLKGKNGGITVAGTTGWTQGKTPKLIKVEVATKACGYKKTPRYFTSLVGFTNHWRAVGGHINYFPKVNKFTTYVTYDNNITPKMAEGYKWQISWLGYDGKQARQRCALLRCALLRCAALCEIR